MNESERTRRLDKQVAELTARLASNVCARCHADPSTMQRGVLVYTVDELDDDGKPPRVCPTCRRPPVVCLPSNGR